MAKILVTGATGFIGKRLIGALLAENHEVWALVRTRGLAVFPTEDPHLHTLWADMQKPEALRDLPQEVTVAFYLMHSMGDLSQDFAEIERQVAENFVACAQKTGIQQIIYLTGIINDTHLSPHLKSRLAVEEILKGSGIPVTILRASIIVGAGSASFEIIRDLVEKLPVMVAPRWISSLCQPIAIRDVLFYLQAVVHRPECFNRIFDIGGPEIMTFKQALMQFAELRGLKRTIITVPILTPRLSSYWLVFVTSVNFSLAFNLVESMKSNTVCKDHSIQTIAPHTCMNYVEAIRLAFLKIAQNEVTSTWMDAWSTDIDLDKYIQVPTEAVFTDRQEVLIVGNEEKVLANIWSIGGKQGWYALNWLWNVRGVIDKLVGGVGLRRGRRHPNQLQPGDVVDFWRVLKADKKEKQLILYAEMKLPGEAWLEFQIANHKLIQTATFRPRGLWGRLYWYMILPFHYFIFGNMAKHISQD